jgi:GxxExxY protein
LDWVAAQKKMFEPQKAQKGTKRRLHVSLQTNFNPMEMLTKSYLKDLTYQVNGACMEVHRIIGPGLLERVYHKCLKQELEFRGVRFRSESPINLNYKGIDIDTDLRCDLIIENVLVVELKAVEILLPIHEAQLLTYMKLLQIPKGILINFNVLNLYNEGQKTFANKMFRNLPD